MTMMMGWTGLLAARGQEADGNGDRARKLQRELESTRRDAEGMLQVRWIGVGLGDGGWNKLHKHPKPFPLFLPGLYRRVVAFVFACNLAQREAEVHGNG